MKRKVFSLMAAGMVCLVTAFMAGAQQSADMPAAVCQALEQYVALVNSTVAMTNKAARDEQYSTALTALTPVLKQYNRDQLLTQATEYARYCELVTSLDPTDAKLGELVEKKLKIGAALQGLCLPSSPLR